MSVRTDLRAEKGTEMTYSGTFKRRMIQKMSRPDAPSARTLAEEEGLCQATLSRWLRNAGNLGGMKKKNHHSEPEEKTTPRPRRPQDWSLLEKLRVLVEAEGMPSEELGAYLRGEGLHESQLEQWRQAALEALEAPRPRRKQTQERKRIKELERELRRKEKALAEAAALLVLKKKVQAIWGDEDDDTNRRNGG